VITASSSVEMEHMYHKMQNTSPNEVKMEILPLFFMQAAVLKWITCTTKCKTHPDKKLKMEILSLLFMSYQCTRHTMMHDHQDASLSIDSEFTSPNKLPVI
jgi:hypothetical protein